MSNNRAVDGNDNPTAGSTLLIQTNGLLESHQLTMRGNQGAHVIRVVDSSASIAVNTCLIAENTVTPELAIFSGIAPTISQCTFANNSIGGSAVMRASDTIVCDGFDAN